MAAAATVPAAFPIHSLHGYFLLKGKNGLGVMLEVLWLLCCFPGSRSSNSEPMECRALTHLSLCREPYQVERVRDGRSFLSRTVKAVQENRVGPPEKNCTGSLSRVSRPICDVRPK